MFTNTRRLISSLDIFFFSCKQHVVLLKVYQADQLDLHLKYSKDEQPQQRKHNIFSLTTIWQSIARIKEQCI